MMKKTWMVFWAIVALSACSRAALEPSGALMRLTPYLTTSSPIPATKPATPQPQETPLPAPTPTPLVHVVALNETISAIALRYGLDMGAVLAANPDIKPNALPVGTEVIIPIGNTEAQIGLVAESLALEVDEPDCAAAREGGLWCFVTVSNPLSEAAVMVSVTLSLEGVAGEDLGSLDMPLLLEKIDPGQSLPALAYFPSAPQGDFSATARLTSALPLAQSGRAYLPVSIINEQVDLQGRSALVSGELEMDGEEGSQTMMRVAALGFDETGRLVGVRLTEVEMAFEPGNAVDFEMRIYSLGNPVDSIALMAEAYQGKQ